MGGLQLKDLNKILIINPHNKDYLVIKKESDKRGDKVTPMINYLIALSETYEIEKVSYYDDTNFHVNKFIENMNPESEHCRDKRLSETLKGKITAKVVNKYSNTFTELVKLYHKEEIENSFSEKVRF